MAYQDPNCKHPDLIVQRNNGIRWITCAACLTDFYPVPDEPPAPIPDAIVANLSVRRALNDLVAAITVALIDEED